MILCSSSSHDVIVPGSLSGSLSNGEFPNLQSLATSKQKVKFVSILIDYLMSFSSHLLPSELSNGKNNHSYNNHVLITCLELLLCKSCGIKGARCSSIIDSTLMVHCFIGLIPHGGPFELFLIPASAPRLV